MSLIKPVARVLLWILALSIAIMSYRFLILGVPVSMPDMVDHLGPRPWALYLHIGLAPVALIVLPFQFSTRLRATRPAVHRVMGRIYTIAIVIAGGAGFVLGVKSDAGGVVQTGFATLAVAWVVITSIATWLAITGRIMDHKRWMIRSAALTFAAVTLRLELLVLSPLVGFETAYLTVSWLCWLPNMVAAELWLRRRSVRSLQHTFG